MKMLKNKHFVLAFANVSGMMGGMMIGFAAACALKKHMASKNSLKSRAKRAFKTIEDTISM